MRGTSGLSSTASGRYSSSRPSMSCARVRRSHSSWTYWASALVSVVYTPVVAPRSGMCIALQTSAKGQDQNVYVRGWSQGQCSRRAHPVEPVRPRPRAGRGIVRRPVAAGDPGRTRGQTVIAGWRARSACRNTSVHRYRPSSSTIDGGLIRVRTQGRHRCHELAGPRVARVLEALAQLAPTKPIRSLRQQRRASTLTEARTCYDHLAGRRGVELRDWLLSCGALHQVDDRDHDLTPYGQKLIGDLGIDLDAVRPSGESSLAAVSTGRYDAPTSQERSQPLSLNTSSRSDGCPAHQIVASRLPTTTSSASTNGSQYQRGHECQKRAGCDATYSGPHSVEKPR
jgi:hypothetical protein